jgi:hypothetical protein
MPKNKEKYRYFDVGLAHESWTLQQLEQDAELHQMDDQPARLIALRLTEYYKLAEVAAFIPGITARLTAEVPVASNGHVERTNATPSPTASLKSEQRRKPKLAKEPETDPAEESADYWGTL